MRAAGGASRLTRRGSFRRAAAPGRGRLIVDDTAGAGRSRRPLRPGIPASKSAARWISALSHALALGGFVSRSGFAGTPPSRPAEAESRDIRIACKARPAGVAHTNPAGVVWMSLGEVSAKRRGPSSGEGKPAARARFIVAAPSDAAKRAHTRRQRCGPRIRAASSGARRASPWVPPLLCPLGTRMHR